MRKELFISTAERETNSKQQGRGAIVMHKSSILAATAALLLGTPSIGLAEGPYVVVFGGQSSFKSNATASDIDALLNDQLATVGLYFEDGRYSLDDSDTVFGATLGYQVGDNFAAEISYVDLGSTSLRASGVVTDGYDSFDTKFSAEISAKGPVGSFLAIWPVHERFSAFARVGIALMNTEAQVKVSLTDAGETTSVSEKFSTTRSNAMYGVGADFFFTEHVGARLEWSRYAKVGSEELTGEGDVDVYVVGIRYRF